MKTRIIDLTGFTIAEVKQLVSNEGYHPRSFYRIWKAKVMRVAVETK